MDHPEKKKPVLRISRRLATIDFMAGAFLMYLAVRSALRAVRTIQSVGFNFSVIIAITIVIFFGGVGILLLGQIPFRLAKAQIEDAEKEQEKLEAEKAAQEKAAAEKANSEKKA